MNFSKKDKTFIGVITLVHVAFFLLALRFTRIYMGDSFEYIYEALNIKQYLFFYSGNPAMPIEPEYMTQRQPLYPLMLLIVYLFSVNNWIVIVLQNLLSVFNIYYTRKALIKLGYNDRYDRLLLLFICAYPAQFINANTIAPDILLQTCTLLYFGNFISFVQTKQMKYSIYMSLALIAGFMVKPVLYPFVIPHIAIVLVVAAMQKAKLQRPMLIAIMPLCAVLLYNYWNYTRTGKFHFSSNQAFNASYYYYPFISRQAGADSANRFLIAERQEYAALPDYKDRYDHANARGMQMLKQHFLPYMAFHLQHAGRIFIEPGKAEIDLFTGRLTYGRLYSKEQTGFFATLKSKGWGGMADYWQHNPSMAVVIIVLLFNCVRLIGFIRFLFMRSVPGLVRSFIFILVVYFAVAAGPIANTRYFLPVSLIVIGCGVMGLIHMSGKKDKKTNRFAIESTIH